MRRARRKTKSKASRVPSFCKMLGAPPLGVVIPGVVPPPGGMMV